MKFHEFVTKLQNLPDKNKKIILWTIVGVLGLIMAIFWIRGVIATFYKITNNSI